MSSEDAPVDRVPSPLHHEQQDKHIEYEKHHQKSTSTTTRHIMLGIYSIALLCVFTLSLQALDGSQLDGWKTWWKYSSAMEMYELQAFKLPETHEERVAASRLCRCGGLLTLVVDYIGSDSRNDTMYEIPKELHRHVLRPLMNGRRVEQMQVCQKNIVATYVQYDDDMMRHGLLAQGDYGETLHLDMAGAYRFGWSIHDSIAEYPEDGHTRGALMHLMVVDVSRALQGMPDQTLGFPMLGVLSETDAIAIVDINHTDSITGLVHEIDAWIYGDGLVQSLQMGRQQVANACRIDATINMKRLLNVLQHARHTRISPKISSSIETILETEHHVAQHSDDVGQSASVESSYLQSRRVYQVLHSPDFGVEPRMPTMHIIALLMPFGLPLAFALIHSVKFLLSAKKQNSRIPVMGGSEMQKMKEI